MISGLIALAVSAAFFLGGGGVDDGAAGGPLHVLIITLDTTRYDHLGFHFSSELGISPTPCLDELAREGHALHLGVFFFSPDGAFARHFPDGARAS